MKSNVEGFGHLTSVNALKRSGEHKVC